MSWELVLRSKRKLYPKLDGMVGIYVLELCNPAFLTLRAGPSNGHTVEHTAATYAHSSLALRPYGVAGGQGAGSAGRGMQAMQPDAGWAVEPA